MLVIALTGGIGAGKSSASKLLVERGAVLVDADAVARELQRPGGAGFQPIVDRFGPGVVAENGELDRAAIASIVFSDDAARNDLNMIMWPLIGSTINERVAANADTDNVVLLDIPLLGASGNAYTVAGTIVVDCPIEIALDRLVSQRGMDPDDAARRIAAQITREQRVEMADFVIDNSGPPEDLALAVDECWAWIASLPGETSSVGDVVPA
ncbi:MAG: dephospho-CoA kinase [Actinomycetota bacterium]